MSRLPDNRPNHIPYKERAFNIGASLLLFVYGGYGIYINDLYLPGRRRRGIHLHDDPAWVMYGAFLCACLVMLSVVVDHYDKRNNEHKYRKFAAAFKVAGWGLFIGSLALSIVTAGARQGRMW